MNLLDAVFMITQMQDTSCICCKRPFHRSSEAVIVTLTAEYAVPQETIAAGFAYFLEQEDVLRLLSWADGVLKSRESIVELVAYYAEYDATPAWFDDLVRQA